MRPRKNTFQEGQNISNYLINISLIEVSCDLDKRRLISTEHLSKTKGFKDVCRMCLRNGHALTPQQKHQGAKGVSLSEGNTQSLTII